MSTCLVLGGAASVFEEAERALDLAEFDGVVACKRIVEIWQGPLVAFATLHPDSAPISLAKRKAAGYSMAFVTVTINGEAHAQHTARLPDALVTTDWGGSSGLFGVKTARLLGYDRIVVAGIPMAACAHFDRDQPWSTAHSYHKGWRTHANQLAPFVRSMSGWTKALLGSPTSDWLNSGGVCQQHTPFAEAALKVMQHTSNGLASRANMPCC